jgi:flotillin
MENAAERLLGLSLDDIQKLAQDIIFGQIRAVIASMPTQEISSDRSKLLGSISSEAEAKLREIGIRLININIKDVTAGKAEEAEKAASPPPPVSRTDE